MKRNGIINLVRCWLIETFGESSPYKEIIPRNYLHALQMNSFSLRRTTTHGDGISECNHEFGIIILPYNEHYDLIDDYAMLEIIKSWIEPEIEDPIVNTMRIEYCIVGRYVADSGETFNDRSLCLYLSNVQMLALAKLAFTIKNKSGLGIVLFQKSGSHKIYGI